MQASNIPTKFPLPFAADAGTSFINPIPAASQIGINPGFASLTDGFVPLNAQNIGAGGVPPRIQDMNGILQQVSAWAQWTAAGGPVSYDSAFSTAIGGYPRGAILTASAIGANAGSWWVSTVDNNTTNPDSGGGNWLNVRYGSNSVIDSGTANAMVATLPNAPVNLAAIEGVPIYIIKSNTPNTGPLTLNLNGLGAVAVETTSGAAYQPGQWLGSAIGVVIYNGSSFVTINQTGPLGQQSLTGGYTIFPPGTDGKSMIMQWGTATTGTGGVVMITFPIAFPNACLNVQVTNGSAAGVPGTNDYMGVGSFSTTGCTIGARSGIPTIAAIWFAIGF